MLDSCPSWFPKQLVWVRIIPYFDDLIELSSKIDTGVYSGNIVDHHFYGWYLSNIRFRGANPLWSQKSTNDFTVGHPYCGSIHVHNDVVL